MNYCAFDNLNTTLREDGTEVHACKYFGTYLCDKCGSCYDGDRIKKYMEEHPKEH